jgi:DNA-directed RNA polymerase specialized sigma24 family protein
MRLQRPLYKAPAPLTQRPTPWTQLKLAAQAGSAQPEALAAFQAFSQRYRSVVYRAIRMRHTEQQAEDLTQQFFLRHIIERDDLKKLDPERGLFRYWLHTTLQHFLIDEWRRATRPKRDQRLEDELDELQATAATVRVSDYERLYANAIVERTFDALHQRWAAKFEKRGIAVDKQTLVTWLVDRDPQAIASFLGIKADNARQTIRRLYVDLWQQLKLDIADTVADEGSLGSELEEICRILGIAAPQESET